MNRWFEEGLIAGHIGDFYDNRDGGHSRFGAGSYPQLQTMEYSPEERKRKIDWGAQTRLLPTVTIGNSSTATTVKKGGCIARLTQV